MCSRTKRLRSVGDSRSIETNFRVLSATNQNLQQSIDKGRFRRDLYYRLSTVTIDLPPLRERREDIPIIIERLAAIEEAAIHRPTPIFTPSALEHLCQRDWPGNIRELKTSCEGFLCCDRARPSQFLKPNNF